MSPLYPRTALRKSLAIALALAVAPAGLLAPTTASAQVSIGLSVRIGPPALPVYAQPPIPGPGYIWTPGYWAWDDWWGDYYWVPGTWVMAPRPGLLWTPGYWGWSDGAYLWHSGYWGWHVGWYGGINYGWGYNGFGFFGGEWRGNNFFYNRAVSNVSNVNNITNVYNRNVTVNNYGTINNTRASYAGGPNGVSAQPTAEQRMAMNEAHIGATAQQASHVQAAQTNRNAFASVNRGRPAQLAVATPRAAPSGPIHPTNLARPAPGGGMPAPAGFVHPATAGWSGRHGAAVATGAAVAPRAASQNWQPTPSQAYHPAQPAYRAPQPAYRAQQQWHPAPQPAFRAAQPVHQPQAQGQAHQPQHANRPPPERKGDGGR